MTARGGPPAWALRLQWGRLKARVAARESGPGGWAWGGAGGGGGGSSGEGRPRGKAPRRASRAV